MKNIVFILISLALLTSCSKIFVEPTTKPQAIFESMWKYADENYAYFEYKNIDWQNVKKKYEVKINDTMTEDSLFSICTLLIDEMRDGHNAISNKKTDYFYDVKKGYDINFDLNLVKSKYLKGAFMTKGNYTFGLINGNIGYIYYKEFYQGSYFKEVMQFMQDNKVSKIIIDIRNNGGGDPAIAQDMLGYFVNTKTFLGTVQHKAGKEHDNFSNKIDVEAFPQSIYFDKKVNVLINRKSYSGSTYFAGMSKALTNFKLIGQITGGGGGGPAAFELPNGWVVRITSNRFTDSQGNQIENGVKPVIEIENSATNITSQLDKMLEKAIEN